MGVTLCILLSATGLLFMVPGAMISCCIMAAALEGSLSRKSKTENDKQVTAPNNASSSDHKVACNSTPYGVLHQIKILVIAMVAKMVRTTMAISITFLTTGMFILVFCLMEENHSTLLISGTCHAIAGTLGIIATLFYFYIVIETSTRDCVYQHCCGLLYFSGAVVALLVARLNWTELHERV